MAFPGKLLIAYGFCLEWVKLVMQLVSTVSYKFKVNGIINEKIIPKRGLRQGDPLSPYLFILAADALSHMIKQGLHEGRLGGIQLSNSAPTLTHLFFADDAVIFAKAEEREAYQLIQILNDYSKASGQRINVLKSGIIFWEVRPLCFASENYKNLGDSNVG